MAKIPRTQFVVMLALGEGRAHAYEIKLRVASELGHSSVYAALARAEAKGWVVSEWEDAGARPPGSGPQRKYYELTGAGREVLREAEELSAASIAASSGATSGVARRPEAQA